MSWIRRWQQLVRETAGDDWAISRDLAYLRPVALVLHGLLAEESDKSRGEFYVWAVAMPLYVPRETLDLNWSERVGGGAQTYSADDPSTVEALRDAVSAVSARASMAETVLDPPGGADNTLMQEARGYGLLLQGDPAGARECLLRVGLREDSVRYPWQRTMVDRANGMRDLIESDRADDARLQLTTWREETARNLGVKLDK